MLPRTDDEGAMLPRKRRGGSSSRRIVRKNEANLGVEDKNYLKYQKSCQWRPMVRRNSSKFLTFFIAVGRVGPMQEACPGQTGQVAVVPGPDRSSCCRHSWQTRGVAEGRAQQA